MGKPVEIGLAVEGNFMKTAAQIRKALKMWYAGDKVALICDTTGMTEATLKRHLRRHEAKYDPPPR